MAGKGLRVTPRAVNATKAARRTGRDMGVRVPGTTAVLLFSLAAYRVS
jgi:hypothetical protein